MLVVGLGRLLPLVERFVAPRARCAPTGRSGSSPITFWNSVTAAAWSPPVVQHLRQIERRDRVARLHLLRAAQRLDGLVQRCSCAKALPRFT